jgi:hypothetical protein
VRRLRRKLLRRLTKATCPCSSRIHRGRRRSERHRRALLGFDSGEQIGWSSGLPLHGFQGDAAGSKIFATKFRMPIGAKTPAYWILPSQVIRSSQYGCNCRGAGSDPVYKGGCGELDVAEILGGVTTSLEATTTLYSFQDITGGGSVAFNRPVNESSVFLVIFDAPSGAIAIRRLGATDSTSARPIVRPRRVAAADTGTASAAVNQPTAGGAARVGQCPDRRPSSRPCTPHSADSRPPSRT